MRELAAGFIGLVVAAVAVAGRKLLLDWWALTGAMVASSKSKGWILVALERALSGVACSAVGAAAVMLSIPEVADEDTMRTCALLGLGVGIALEQLGAWNHMCAGFEADCRRFGYVEGGDLSGTMTLRGWPFVAVALVGAPFAVAVLAPSALVGVLLTVAGWGQWLVNVPVLGWLLVGGAVINFIGSLVLGGAGLVRLISWPARGGMVDLP